MMNKLQMDCVDRSIRDLMTGHPNGNQPFGGKVVVFAGDFRQVLPVVPHGERAKIVQMTIKRWSLWPSVRQFHLTENMRQRRQNSQTSNNAGGAFAQYLLRIGNGEEHTTNHGRFEDFVRLPECSCNGQQTADVNVLINSVFPHMDDAASVAKRAILAPKNSDCDEINLECLSRFAGDMHTFTSADSVADEEAAALFPVEFLNNLNVSGLPPHRLNLKLNCPMILLRNLDQSRGLCNGTRLICRGFQQHLIDAEISSGSHIGLRVFIPRITLTPSDANLPFQLRRRQFPVRLAFSMTINKSQR
jgi:hypothetical protein